MLEAVRALCAERDVPAQLALESGMACGFGACFGCVVPLADGGYARVCVDGPGVRRRRSSRRCRRLRRLSHVDRASAASTLEHPVVNGRGPSTRSPRGAPSATRCSSDFPFSAFVSKTITLEPRAGNPPPRLWETPAGMINSIGLPNKGLDGYLEQDLPQLAELPVPLIVNVMGFDREELAELVGGLRRAPEVAAIELNVSCPNVETGLVIGRGPGRDRARRRRACGR